MVVRHSISMLLACTASAVLCLAAVAHAQSAPATTPTTSADGSTVLNRIVVQGKGKRVQAGSAADDTPLATETTKQTIDDKQITSIEDLGRTTEPGVSFNRDKGTVNIRGLEGSRVLTTIDGIPVPYLSDATRSATGGADAFDFQALSAVDILRGSDSSRAGAGALGGVLALRTLEPEDLIGEGRNWGGIAKFTFDGSDNSWAPSAAVAKKIENTSVLFQGSYKKGQERKNQGDVDTYGVTRTEPNPSDYDQHSLMFKLRQKLEGGHTFGLTAESFRKDSTTDSKTSQAIGGNYRPGDYETNKATGRDRVSLDYAFESESADSLLDNAWASLYWQKQSRATGYDGYRSSSVIGPIGRLNDYNERTIGIIGAMDKEFSTGNVDHTLTFGFDLATSMSEQYSSGYDNCPAPLASGSYPTGYTACANLHTNQADTPKVDSKRVGFYVDDKMSIGDSGFSLTPGVRFDWLEHSPTMTQAFDDNTSNPELPDGFSDTAISPKLRAVYEAAPNLEFYAQWAMGFRAPNAGELYSVFGGPGTYLRLGKSDLESETSNGFEVGANLGDEDFGGRVNVFYNKYKNFIDTKQLNAAEAAEMGYNLASYRQGGISSYINIDRARIFGAEFSAHKKFDYGITLRAGVAYANGKNLDDGTFLQSVAPLKSIVGIDYDAGQWGASIDWIASAAGRGESTSTYFKTPGYGIVDLTAWYEPEQVKGLKINAGIYNVFDKSYYDYASVRNTVGQPESYYSEPGRTFKISLTQKF